MKVTITRHAAERAAKRFGEDFDVEAALRRATRIGGSQYRRQQKYQRQQGKQLLPHRDQVFLDETTRALFVTERGREGVMTVVTVWRSPAPSERVLN